MECRKKGPGEPIYSWLDVNDLLAKRLDKGRIIYSIENAAPN